MHRARCGAARAGAYIGTFVPISLFDTCHGVMRFYSGFEYIVINWVQKSAHGAGAHRLDEAKIGPGEDHEQPFCPIGFLPR